MDTIGELAAALDKVAAALPSTIEAADGRALEVIKAAATPITPRQSGVLAASPRVAGAKLTWTAPYAFFVWGGTVHMQGQPFATDALRASQSEWVAIYEDTLTDALTNL